MELLEQAPGWTPVPAEISSPVVDGGERAARRSLRGQIERLERELSDAFVTAFNGAAPLPQRLALLQSGPSFQDGLSTPAATAVITHTSATVSQVTLTSAVVARVIYTLSLSGVETVKNQPGTAVSIGGTWKVSAGTFCALLAATRQVPSACAQASVTALPS